MNQRGAAMVETALVMSIVLMLTFGAIQLSLIAFSQSAQDGAAFVASREYAQNAAGGTAVAQSAAHNTFSSVKGSDLAISASGSNVTASARTSVAGLGVPGTPGTFPLESSATEPAGAPAPSGQATPFPFSTSDKLTNYRDYASNVANPNYAILTAQKFGGSNGINGFFAEFDCRETVYSQLTFPDYPSNANATWDPIHGTYRAVYVWDTGVTCT